MKNVFVSSSLSPIILSSYSLSLSSTAGYGYIDSFHLNGLIINSKLIDGQPNKLFLNKQASSKTIIGNSDGDNSSTLFVKGNTYVDGTATITTVSATNDFGKTYSQTSTASSTAVIDTDITRNSSHGFGYGSIYELYMTTNTQGNTGSIYRVVNMGYVTISTDTTNYSMIKYTSILAENGGNAQLNVAGIDVVFIDGNTEYANIINTDTTSNIRVKINGYTTHPIGSSLVLRLTKKL